MNVITRSTVGAALVGALVGGVAVAAIEAPAAIKASRGDVYVVTTKASSGLGAISTRSGGYTYRIPLDGAWKDTRGTFHEHGRPACLPPSGRDEGPIRIRAIEVLADGFKFRQVFFVECM